MDLEQDKFINPVSDVHGCLKSGKLSVANRLFIIRSIEQGTKTAAEWHRELRSVAPTRRKTINDWVYLTRKGHGVSDAPGRPPLCLDKDRADIRSKIRSHELTRGVVEDSYVKGLICDAATKAFNRNHMTPVNRRTTPCYNSIMKQKHLANVKTGNAETGTAARLDAEGDLRSAAALVAACHLMMPRTCYDLVFNSDATQFEVGWVSKKRRASYIADDQPDDFSQHGARKKPRRRDELKLAPNKKSAGITSFFVKYYCMCNASGMIAPPIYIIADDMMPEDVRG
jgi:hypothetical protein